MIRESERLGFDSLESEYRSDYRKNDRLIIDNEVLAADFYKRVAPYIPEEGGFFFLIWTNFSLSATSFS